MAFNSLEYAIFLVVVFLGFWALARIGLARIVFLTLASFVFYAASNPWFLTLIVASTLIDYYVGIGLDRTDDPRRRKALITFSVVANLGMLGVFKYTNFFLEMGVYTGNLLGADLTFTRLDILLPAGISFYTFQTLSYSIDVYRRQLKAEHDFLRFALFVAYFPQLVAGPIVRAADFLPQTHKRPFFSHQQASRAMWLIAIGIFKKVVIADALGVNIVQRVWDETALVSSWDVIIGLYAYTMQIYMDFSAYSDIAIGSALLFGYHLPDNFDRPYMATSVQDFWRRWHKTLGSFLRDYIYYPLGGGQVSDAKVYRNLFITFLLIGLWHGANIAFVIYGAGHALAMSINRWLRKRRGDAKLELGIWGYVWRVFLTLNFVVFMRALFRSAPPESTSVEALEKTGEIFARIGEGLFSDVTVMGGDPWLWVVFIGSFVVHWTPRYWVEATFSGFRRLPFALQGALFVAALMVMGLALGGRPLPFEYFQF
jgi:alginate O-acetyltransferase complex protein AlgI